jgi:hypothetical protein
MNCLRVEPAAAATVGQMNYHPQKQMSPYDEQQHEYQQQQQQLYSMPPQDMGRHARE